MPSTRSNRVLPFYAGLILLSWGPFHLGQSHASDLPALIDDRQPTLSPPLQEVREQQLRSTTRVELPVSPGELDRDMRIPVEHVNIVGGSVFDLESLAVDLVPMVGHEVRLGDLIDAVEAITKRYQKADYPLSYAYLPTNNFVDGTVTVVVVEGHIVRNEILITNAAVAARVERLANRMHGERPLTRATFERYTALIDRIPGAQLAISAPVPRTPSGGTTLRVEERDTRRIQAGLSVDGGNEDDFLVLGNLSLQANTPYGEKLSFAALMPVDNDNEFYAVEYQQQLGSDGLRITLGANRFDSSDNEPLLLLGQELDVHESKVRNRFRAAADYPLLLRRTRLWEVGMAVDHHNERADYDIRLDGELLRHTRQNLRYSAIELNTTYRIGDEQRLLEIRGDLRQGVDLGANRNEIHAEEQLVASDESLHFTRSGVQARWAEQLTPNWRLSTRLAGFWSDDRLPMAERGNYGGSRFGRAYPDGQAEGDKGYAGEVELRYLHSLKGKAWLTRIEPYVLVDAARTEFNQHDIQSELISAVGGVELSNLANYRLGVEYAHPMGDRDQESGRRSGRINARITWQFGG
ncbi:MAG: ShlB/FhaC/HecB family hemolysin secretion/activation protein [Halomonadaceae bacterium]|jgi:hemolysin activation/secretion protein